MSKITAEEILDEVRDVIRHAFHGLRKTPSWVMAHQVLCRMSTVTHGRLVADHGESGLGSGNHFPGSQVVKQALLMLHKNEEVTIDYLDANNEISIDQPGGAIKPGNPTVAIYRYVG